MITYKIDFPALDCAPSEDGLSDVVKAMHWKIEASEPKNWEDPNLGYYKAVAGGATQLEPPSGTFIPFESLTSGILLNWLEAKLNISGVDGVYSGLAAQIEKQKNPTIVRKYLGESGYSLIG